MPNPIAPATSLRRLIALAAMAAALLAAALPALATADTGTNVEKTPGQLLTLYAGSAPSHVNSVTVPPKALGASANCQSLSATSTIAVTYHGFANQPKAKAAFQAAVDVWQSILVSSQIIHVDAYWANLGASSGILGQASATFGYNGLDGFRYPAALAEARCSCEVNSGAEIDAEFNSAFADWYKGTDGNVPNSKWDLETVVLHELGHGLGFYSSFRVLNSKGYRNTSHPLRFDANEWDNVTGGHRMTTYPNASGSLRSQLTDGSVYLGGTHVQAVLGKRAKLYAPIFWQPGSSNSHLDESKYPPGSVNGLMTPILNNGESIHDPGPATKAIFQDIGWTIAGSSGDSTPPVVDSPAVRIVAPQTMSSKVSVRVSWPAATDELGIASYELQREVGAAPWVAVALASPTATSAQVAVTRGSNTAFRVRATDGASNVGSWTTTTRHDDHVPGDIPNFAYSGSWTHATLSGSAGGSVEQSSAANDTATFTFKGTSVALRHYDRAAHAASPRSRSTARSWARRSLLRRPRRRGWRGRPTLRWRRARTP